MSETLCKAIPAMTNGCLGWPVLSVRYYRQSKIKAVGEPFRFADEISELAKESGIS